MRIADWIAQRCSELNPHTFLFVGGGNMYLADALGRRGVQYRCMHNEQALAMAAEAYARITSKPSVCVVTTGPGGTNAITGLYGAWVDSIPILFISGQVRTETLRRGNIRQIGDQEVNIIDVVRPLTKVATLCKSPDEVEEMFNLALYEASTGRQGPVWLDIPLDVQKAEYPGNSCQATYPTPEYIYDINEILYTLLQAKRPIVLAGSGIRSAGAIDLFWKTMNKLRIPVIPNFNARDLGPFHYPTFGMQGEAICNLLIDQADVILILGCRMNIRQIGWKFGEFGKKAKKIMVDVDPEELNKHTFVPDVKVEADLRDFLTVLNGSLEIGLYGTYNEFGAIGHMWPPYITKVRYVRCTDSVNPYEFIQELNDFTVTGDVVAFANGLFPTTGIQDLAVKRGMRFILNSGCGAMGYGLPAAIGAAFASGNRVICLEGDGSIQLNIQELQTVVHHNLPIKIFVGNNNGYNSIKNTQDAYFHGFYVAKDADTGVSFPNMEKIAWAYGIKYYRAENDVQVPHILNCVFEDDKPVICELNLDPNFKLRKAEI